MKKTTSTPRQVKALDLLDARWKRFDKDWKEYEREYEADQTMNAFLESYQLSKTDPRWQVQYRTVCLLFELHRLRPSFVGEIVFH